MSIFGELTIARAVYGSREGQRIEQVPLDERLGLPEGDFSYVLEDWSQRLCLKESFAEAGRSLEMLLGLKLGARTLEHMSRAVAGDAPAFQDALPLPPPEEEGPLLVVTADGKGVPMRRPPQDGPRPHHRRTKGREGEQEADGLRRGRLHHRAVRAEGRRHPRRGAAGRAGRGSARSRSTSTSGPR